MLGAQQVIAVSVWLRFFDQQRSPVAFWQASTPALLLAPILLAIPWRAVRSARPPA